VRARAQVVLARLGKFVQPYLPQLLRALARPLYCEPDAAPPSALPRACGSADLRAKGASARKLLAERAELRLLLPAVAQLVDEAAAAAAAAAAVAAEPAGASAASPSPSPSPSLCVPPLLEALAHAVCAAERGAVVAQHGRLWRLAMHALARRDALAGGALGGGGGGGGSAAAAAARETVAVESAAIGLVVALTLRLNDSLFAPLYDGALAWANATTAAPGGEASLACARAWPLLGLASALLERLRGLATPYAARALPLVVTALQARADASHAAGGGGGGGKRRKGAGGGASAAADGGGELGALARLSAQVARLTLVHDVATGALDGSALDALVSPLVGCAAAEAADGDEAGRALLAAAVGALGGALGGAGCARLHFELCALSRDEAAAARLQALRCLGALYAALGADGAVHVAEAVPALAELLEDADEPVEAAARALLKEVAAATGEDVEALIRG
jgi:hypothetical protein